MDADFKAFMKQWEPFVEVPTFYFHLFLITDKERK